MVGDSVKFDPDPFSPRPPNLGIMNDDGSVLSRREQKESDIHACNDLNRVFNTTTISGKIHRSDGIRPPFAIDKKRSRQGDRKSLMAALYHDYSDKSCSGESMHPVDKDFGSLIRREFGESMAQFQPNFEHICHAALTQVAQEH